MPNPENPHAAGGESPIPDVWKSLIQDGVYGVDKQRTEEYLASDPGKAELAAEASYDEIDDFVNKRLAENARAVAAGQMSKELAEKQNQRWEAFREKRLEQAVKKIDDARADYQGYQMVGTPEEMARYQQWLEAKDAENMENLAATGREVMANEGEKVSRVVLQERGEKTVEATKTPEDQPAQPTPEAQPATENQPTPNAQPEQKPTPEQKPGQQPAEQKPAEQQPEQPEEGKKAAEVKVPAELEAKFAEYDKYLKPEYAEQLKAAALLMYEGEKQIEAAKAAERAKAKADVESIVDAAMADLEADKAAELERAKAAEIEADKAAEIEADKAAETAEDKNAAKTKERIEKAKKKKGFKKALVAGVAVALAGIIALGSFLGIGMKNRDNTPVDPGTRVEQTDDSYDSYDDYVADQAEDASEEGKQFETMANGVSYNYSEYADRENKISKNAYGYDKSAAFGDRDATADAWMDMAEDGPEYLGSYVFYALTDSEKADLGIAGMTASEIDNYMSDAKNIDGGAKQKAILEKLSEIAHDEENTRYDFYYENDSENSYYIMFNDLNGDGIMTPDELTLGYSWVQRHNAPQVDVYRNIDGQWVKVLDLNMQCGFQPNFVTPPDDLPPTPPGDEDSAGSEGSDDDSTGGEGTEDDDSAGGEGSEDDSAGSEGSEDDSAGSEGSEDDSAGSEGSEDDSAGSEGSDSAGNEGSEWGKDGDPHGGDLVDPSDLVDPNSEVSQEENDATNESNQGYVDDNQAQPGSASENNGTNDEGFSQNIAPGADTDGGRLEGGESQDTGGTNGTNENAPTEEAVERDQGGNAAQAEAQASGGENGAGAEAGGNNYSDAAEEAAVENGDF